MTRPGLTTDERRADTFFDLVADRLTFSDINPMNEKGAKQRFLKHGKEPQFRYGQPAEELSQFKAGLELLPKLEDGAAASILNCKQQELIRKIRLLERLGTPGFATTSAQLYPLPDKKLLEQAHALLRLPPSGKAKRITRVEGIKLIRKVFDHLGLKYAIRSSPILTSARMQAGNRLLELKKRERFSEDYLKRLVVHEIGTHALRGENGALQPLRMFKNGFPGYLDAEEGLAVYNEYRAGLLTNSILRNYAGRIVAIDTASKAGFKETYKELRKHFTQKTAWKLAVRAKRGLKDTSKPGAYTKDTVYLRGFTTILGFAKNHDPNELYQGKIAPKDLTAIRNIPHLKKPRFLLQSVLDKDLITPTERRVEEETIRQLTK